MRRWKRMENNYLQRNGKESDYVQMSWERSDLEYGVGDLIYRNKRKEIKLLTFFSPEAYLESLATMLP